jgi:antitoxin MazE
MQTHIQKWGNSLGVRIPAKLAQELYIKPGSTVDLFVEDHRLVIKPQKYQLDDLLQQITEKNIHHALLEDESIGVEEW